MDRHPDEQAAPRRLARGRVDPAARAAAIAGLAQALAAQGADTSRLEREVVRRVSELVGDAVALWRRDDEGHIGLVAFSHWEARRRAYMEQHAKDATHDDVVGVLPHVWNEGKSFTLDEVALAGWLPVMQPAYQEYARRHGMVSLMVVPLRVRGNVVALLGVSRDEQPGHDEDDLTFVQQVGSVIAVALEHDRLLRQVRQQAVEERRAQRAAHRAALHDPLTGLPNRRMLTQRLSASTAHEHEVTLALLDMDDFKSLNDAYGHHVGDAALVQVADRLRSALDKHSPGPRRTLVRLGGDEFAVLITAPTSADQVATVMSALVASLEVPLSIGGREVRTSVSIGIARGSAADGSHLLRHADIAMYRAKHARLGWVEYTAADDEAAEHRFEQLTDLDRALTSGELVVHYQPIVGRAAAEDDGLRLAEALVRWEHPTRGLLPPAAFLPLAQQSGRMGALTQAVLALVLADLAGWYDAGHRVRVSVNVGADVLSGPEFVPGLLADLAAAGLPTSALCLELTESEALSADGVVLLSGLREHGLAVALDDFGTGYANLGYLTDLPLTLLKLDRSFVARLSADGPAGLFVAGIVDTIHRLGLPIVAEGVEDLPVAELLDELKVGYQQGFLHARPQSTEQLGAGWPLP